MELFRQTNIDFLRWKWWAIGASWVLILVGLLAIFVSGLGGPIAHVTTDTYVAATTAPDRLARVFALQRTAIDIATAAGMATCGAILALIPPQAALLLAGAGIVTLTLAAATATGTGKRAGSVAMLRTRGRA